MFSVALLWVMNMQMKGNCFKWELQILKMGMDVLHIMNLTVQYANRCQKPTYISFLSFQLIVGIRFPILHIRMWLPVSCLE